VGIVGPAYSSSVVTTYEQVTGPAGIPLCSYAATSPVLSTLPGAGDLIWRTVPSDALQGVVLAEQTRTLGVSSVAVMYRDDIYGDALAATFQARYQSLGGTITTSVAFPPDQTSGHGATVDQALAPGVPSAILIVGAELESADLLLQLQLANPQPKPVLLGVDALYGPTFLANAPQAYLEGMYGTTNDTPVGEPDYDLFAAAYQARAGTLPSPGLEGAYDAVYLMALAMAQDGANTSEAIRTHLRAVSGGLGGAATAIHPGQFAAGLQAIQAGLPINYQGASGPIDFDAHGDVTSATYLWWRVTGDQFVTVATIQVP